MQPAALAPFFAASMGAAAALLGLLFVAVSIEPGRTVGVTAPVERQMVAESVFTALVNAFFVSMAGATGVINVGTVALPLSAFALFQTLHVAWRLRPRQFTIQSIFQRLSLVAIALVIYGFQFVDAAQLLRPASTTASVGSEVGLLFALYAFGLGRSWELLGARRGILTGGLSPLGGDSHQPSQSGPATPLLATEGPTVLPATGATGESAVVQ
jgi:hypothetical protein